MQPDTALCASWATLADLCSPCDDYAMDAANLEDWLLVASEVLYQLSGRQWKGECADTVRPCCSGCPGWHPSGWPDVHDPCRTARDLVLPLQPVTDVLAVKIDGVTLDAARYRVDDWARLVYLPESADAERQGWPTCQDMSLDTTEVGTWEVSYLHGAPPPPGGVKAAAALGCELALACQPELVGRCRLPRRVTTITRQGISMTVLTDLTKMFELGMTGLPEVDLWLSAHRVGRGARGAAVYDPMAMAKARRAGT